jgi:hypothetical protein
VCEYLVDGFPPLPKYGTETAAVVGKEFYAGELNPDEIKHEI